MEDDITNDDGAVAELAKCEKCGGEMTEGHVCPTVKTSDDEPTDDKEATTDTPVAEPAEDSESSGEPVVEKTEEVTEEPVAEVPAVEPVAEKAEEITEEDGYQFDDALDTPSTPKPAAKPASNAGGGFSSGGGTYADELFTKTVHAKFRTFYIDLKESRNGKFVKISEKSKGRKSTVMMDCEDVPHIIEALQEVQAKM